MRLQYVRKRDYLYLSLTFTTGDRTIGIWGNRRMSYLKEYCIDLYTELLLTGTLNDHLADINVEAEAFFVVKLDYLYLHINLRVIVPGTYILK